jgi:hypothetical protein
VRDERSLFERINVPPKKWEAYLMVGTIGFLVVVIALALAVF